MASSSSIIQDITPLPSAGPMPTLDPFIFCVHHDDNFPAGNDQLGPSASLAGRNIGADFSNRDGWNMYHGSKVPGFPRHPHRGFETVTVVRQGLLDHSDSLGCKGRFGNGDTQWMTAGKGVCHAEMFPLLDSKNRNKVELYQIWLNLPAKSKMVEPHYKMLWSENTPIFEEEGVKVMTVAGHLPSINAPPSPPPDSWASEDDSHVMIWTITLAPAAQWVVPAGPAGVNRSLYFVSGASAEIDSVSMNKRARVDVKSDVDVNVGNPSNGPIEILLLQGRPIDEPVAQHGPFVMNSREEIMQAFRDYQETEFGGWPWDQDGVVNSRDTPRFALFEDGQEEFPGAQETA